jgi:hypothetical protein
MPGTAAGANTRNHGRHSGGSPAIAAGAIARNSGRHSGGSLVIAAGPGRTAAPNPYAALGRIAGPGRNGVNQTVSAG